MKCWNRSCPAWTREKISNCGSITTTPDECEMSFCGANLLHESAAESKVQAASALDVQVGGGHYKNMVIQPIEFTHKNNLNFCQGNIIKYTCRYKDKNGIEDLKKVKHYVDLLMELEYGSK